MPLVFTHRHNIAFFITIVEIFYDVEGHMSCAAKWDARLRRGEGTRQLTKCSCAVLLLVIFVPLISSRCLYKGPKCLFWSIHCSLAYLVWKVYFFVLSNFINYRVFYNCVKYSHKALKHTVLLQIYKKGGPFPPSKLYNLQGVYQVHDSCKCCSNFLVWGPVRSFSWAFPSNFVWVKVALSKIKSSIEVSFVKVQSSTCEQFPKPSHKA